MGIALPTGPVRWAKVEYDRCNYSGSWGYRMQESEFRMKKRAKGLSRNNSINVIAPRNDGTRVAG